MGNTPPMMEYSKMSQEDLCTVVPKSSGKPPPRSYRFRPPVSPLISSWRLMDEASGVDDSAVLEQWVTILNESTPCWRRMLPCATLVVLLGIFAILAGVLVTTFQPQTDLFNAPLWRSPVFWSYALPLWGSLLLPLSVAGFCAAPGASPCVILLHSNGPRQAYCA